MLSRSWACRDGGRRRYVPSLSLPPPVPQCITRFCVASRGEGWRNNVTLAALALDLTLALALALALDGGGYVTRARERMARSAGKIVSSTLFYPILSSPASPVLSCPLFSSLLSFPLLSVSQRLDQEKVCGEGAEGVGLVDTNAAFNPPQRSPSPPPLAGAAMSPFSVTGSPEQLVSLSFL